MEIKGSRNVNVETEQDHALHRVPQSNVHSNADDYRNEARFHPTVRLSYAIFFLSGAAALIYEISWSRQVGLILGQTAHAAAIVLAAYFAGLAFGYHFGGRWAARCSPLRAYGLAELFAAAWACLIPQILSWAATSEVAGLLSQTALQNRLIMGAVFCFLLLLPATAALGATLPLMAQFLSPKSRLSTGRVSLAYALNTLGAVLGVVSTFGLLVILGVRASSYFAAALSAGCGLAALTLAHFRQDVQPAPKLNATTQPLRFGWWEVVAGLSGFCTLALEVLYTRMFSLVFHNSTYTFGAVVAVFLVGLALGSLTISFLHRRFKPETILAVSSLFAAMGVLLSAVMFLRQTQLEYFRGGDSFTTYLLRGFSLVAILILPPVTTAGMLLPTAWKSRENSTPAGSRVVGRLTMINTLAAVGGAVLASFLLLPSIGLWMSFVAIAALFGLIALGSLIRQRQLGRALAFASVIVVIGGLVIPRLTASKPRTTVKGGQVLKRWESAYGWIDVVRDRGGRRQIRQNVHYRMGATGLNAAREYRQAHLPLLLHQNPQDVLFLGLGTGLTAGAAVQHEQVRQIQVVELIPEVVEAARMLSDENLNVVDHQKVAIQVDDARHFLLATDRRFDVIVSDLFVPWESRTGYLYTVEQYRIAQERLHPGGLFCQWLPLYQIGPEEFERIADSFTSVFPNSTLWWGQMQSQQAIVALVGSDQFLNFDEQQINARIEALQTTHAFSDSYFATAAHLSDLFLGRWTTRNPEKLNTDEHPWVEFLAPISQGNGTLLQGPKLRTYFDRVLSKLPAGGVLLPSENPRLQGVEHRRAWQRFLLFGD